MNCYQRGESQRKFADENETAPKYRQENGRFSCLKVIVSQLFLSKANCSMVHYSLFKKKKKTFWKASGTRLKMRPRGILLLSTMRPLTYWTQSISFWSPQTLNLRIVLLAVPMWFHVIILHPKEKKTSVWKMKKPLIRMVASSKKMSGRVFSKVAYEEEMCVRCRGDYFEKV